MAKELISFFTINVWREGERYFYDVRLDPCGEGHQQSSLLWWF